jgi:hypothetical protein
LTAAPIGSIIEQAFRGAATKGAAMAWYGRFHKYRNTEQLRWIVFILAAITGLLIIVITAGLG